MIEHLGTCMPAGLSADDEVAYQLEGDDTRRVDYAGNLNWGLLGQFGRISRYLPITVGSLNSTEPGTAARASGGKPRLDLIPAGVIAEVADEQAAHPPAPAVAWSDVLRYIGGFQMRVDPDRDRALLVNALAAMNTDGRLWAETARVFEYGLQKYAAWNWERGMAWSVPISCAMRHVVAVLNGEPDDAESGLPHRGHAACNLVMLLWHLERYRDGDDRVRRA